MFDRLATAQMLRQLFPEMTEADAVRSFAVFSLTFSLTFSLFFTVFSARSFAACVSLFCRCVFSLCVSSAHVSSLCVFAVCVSFALCFFHCGSIIR